MLHTLTSKAMRKNFTQEEVQFIKDNYPDKGAKFCANFCNRSRQCIIKKAMSLGVKSNCFREKISLYQFTNIQTSEIAYILGFLWADGSLHKNQNTISLEINLLDLKEIESTFDKIGEFSKYYRKQRKNDKQTGTIICCQKDLYLFLEENDYRIKSVTSPDKILSKIPEHLKHYFWRGYFDGDGHARVDIKGRYSIVLAGSYFQDWNFVNNLFSVLEIKYNIKYTKKENPKTNKINQSSCCIIYNKSGFLKFLEYIYQNREIDKIGLNRKYSKLLEGIKQKDKFENIPCRGAIGIEVYDLNNNLIGCYKSVSATAKDLNLSQCCIRAYFKEGWKYYKNFTFKKILPENYSNVIFKESI